jgi:hypothetical protein
MIKRLERLKNTINKYMADIRPDRLTTCESEWKSVVSRRPSVYKTNAKYDSWHQCYLNAHNQTVRTLKDVSDIDIARLIFYSHLSNTCIKEYSMCFIWCSSDEWICFKCVISMSFHTTLLVYMCNYRIWKGTLWIR